MTEFGIFNDEGCVEGGFSSEATALAVLDKRYRDDDCHVSEICPEPGHDEQERHSCEACNVEDEEQAVMDAEDDQ